jgi:Mor family transcriptional regulator
MQENAAWRPVLGFEGIYEISQYGELKRRDGIGRRKERIVKHSIPGTSAYPVVRLCKNGKSVSKCLHVVVAESFLGGRPKGMQCAHLDGDPRNFHASNLAWVSPKTNVSHKKLHGTHLMGESHHLSKLKEADIYDIFAQRCLGSTTAELAKKYDMTWEGINNILKRESWTHLEIPPDWLKFSSRNNMGRKFVLSDQDRLEIKTLYMAGSNKEDLAHKFNVTGSTIRTIISGKKRSER